MVRSRGNACRSCLKPSLGSLPSVSRENGPENPPSQYSPVRVKGLASFPHDLSVNVVKLQAFHLRSPTCFSTWSS
eukprot:364023-Chlamydomonas_euryale.AAC.8